MARPRFSLSTVTLAGLLALGGIGACSTATAEDRYPVHESRPSGQGPMMAA